jgi:hypothetical protein
MEQSHIEDQFRTKMTWRVPSSQCTGAPASVAQRRSPVLLERREMARPGGRIGAGWDSDTHHSGRAETQPSSSRGEKQELHAFRQ